MIDTLEASRILVEHGFSDHQSRGIVKVTFLQEQGLATKADIEILHSEGHSRDKRISLIQWLAGICAGGIIAILIVLVTAL